jgi:hypothetical protein
MRPVADVPGDLTITSLTEALASRKAGTCDPSSKVMVRHGESDRYIAGWTTENGRVVFVTSTVDMWRSPSEREELVERIIKLDRDNNHLRSTIRGLEAQLWEQAA